MWVQIPPTALRSASPTAEARALRACESRCESEADYQIPEAAV